MGFDAVVEELASPKSKAAGLVLAEDVSAKTEKEIRFMAEKYRCDIITAPFSMDEAQETLGKRVGVLLVLDKGLYSSVKNNISSDLN